MSDDTKAPAPFDPAHWISIPDAVALVRSRKRGKDTEKQPLIRKFILGALVRRRDSGLEAIALEFRESFERLSDDQPSLYRAPSERETIVDADFWSLQHAHGEAADYSFQTGNFSWTGEVSWTDMPPHLRDRDADPRAMFRLHREAEGVHVDRPCLEALIAERDWRQWASIAEVARARRQAPPLRFMWNEVAGLLAVEASFRPEILRQGPGPVIRFVTEELTRLNDGNPPDAGEVSKFARYFWKHWPPSDEVAPPN